MIKWLESGKQRPNREDVVSLSPNVRHLWLLWSTGVNVYEFLYKQWYPKLQGQIFYKNMGAEM